MADSLIAASAAPGEVRVALIEDGRLTDYALWRPGSPDGYGDLHVARVEAVVPALAGAFVAIEGESGFLPDSAGARGVSVGQMLAVRVSRSAQGGKGPRLTMVDAAVMPAMLADGPRRLARGPSALTEFATRHPLAVIEVDDLGLVPSLRAAFAERVRHVPRAFTPELDDEVAGLAEPTVTLPGGARLHIQPTRALTAIDIDAGTATGQRSTKGAAQLALNRALLPDLARQIRLRNLSGAIVIDLAGMPARRRAALGPLLTQALAADPLQPRMLGFTALGFAEITRPRQRPPLHEQLATPLAAGLAALRAALHRGGRLGLRAAPAVVTALEADGRGLADLARQSIHKLLLRADPSLPGHHWVLEELP